MQIDGYNERMKGEWERARMIGYDIHVHSMMDKKHKAKTIQKFRPFPWEENIKPRIAGSPKEILEAHRRMVAEQMQKANGGK